MKRVNPAINPWKKPIESLPKQYSPCLLYVRHKDFNQFGYVIVYGYMKFSAGDRNSPNFITPGATQTELQFPELWMHCKDAKTNYQPQDLWKFAGQLLGNTGGEI